MKALEIVQIWNKKYGVWYRFESKGQPSKIVNKIESLINEFGEEAVSKYYVEKMKESESNIWNVTESYLIKEWLDVNQTKEEPKAQPQQEQQSQFNVLSMLSNEIVNLMGQDLANKINVAVENKLNEFVEDKCLIKVIEYKEQRKKVEGIAHKMLEPLLKFVSMDEPTMLVGPAGTGKNVLCKQVADALGLEFYFTSAVTQEYKLTGYGDANGNYVKTQFYEAFTKGGIFLFDEVDASIPEAMVVVNSAIANRYFDFPVVGRVQAHPDFRIIACANTYGTGASMEYVGRNQLDGATLNRFAILEVNYDTRIEEGVCPDKDIREFCQEFRKACNSNGVHHIVSYREMSRIYKMITIAGLDKQLAIRSCLTKGLEKDTLNMILNVMPRHLEYRSCFESMINTL